MRAEDAERYVLARELFGMRFGLDRMRRMMTALEHPEQRFDSIHVVGTNGKSSTVRMIAAILERHSVHTGARSSSLWMDQRSMETLLGTMPKRRSFLATYFATASIVDSKSSWFEAMNSHFRRTSCGVNAGNSA